jgi:hypothetical protein
METQHFSKPQQYCDFKHIGNLNRITLNIDITKNYL